MKRFDDLLGYCKNSANPVGHLVLYLADTRMTSGSGFPTTLARRCNSQTSGRMCRVDWKKARVYLPLEDLRRFGVSEDQIAEGSFNAQFPRIDAL